jgi:hypothetical protein
LKKKYDKFKQEKNQVLQTTQTQLQQYEDRLEQSSDYGFNLFGLKSQKKGPQKTLLGNKFQIVEEEHEVRTDEDKERDFLMDAHLLRLFL